MQIVFSLISGLLFGFGLIVSGMSNPEKVLGFLDLAGNWDPSLMLVMGGAIGIGIFAFTFAKKRTLSFLGLNMQLPTARKIDPRLIVGSMLFGIGWGLAGVCPGPALVLLGAGVNKALYFLLAMLVGMVAFELLNRRQQAAGK